MMQEDNKWELTKSEAGPDLAIFNVRFDYQKNLRNGKVLKATVLESADSVNVVVVTRSQKVVLVRQLRFGTQTETFELPGGLIDEGEDHKTAAIRELKEETGYTATNWQYLGAIQANPVFMDSEIHHWLVTDAMKTDDIKLDEGENIDFYEIDKETLVEMVKNGMIKHPHTLTALSRVFKIWDPIL